MSHIDAKVAQEVVKSLIDVQKKKSAQAAPGKSSLFEDVSAPVFAQIQLVKDVSRKVVRPVRVKVPHSLYFPEEFDHSICFFCRSSDKAALETLFENSKSVNVAKLISLDEVKKEYKRFEDRKALLKAHSHFLCDARIMSHLYNLLGKVFAVNNHYPVPVDFDSIDNKVFSAIQKSVYESTYMHIKGQTITIRLGYTFMAAKDITENICKGLEFAVPKLKDEWKSVHSVYLKTSSSAAIPIYSKTKSQQLEFVKQAVQESEKKSAPASAKKEPASAKKGDSKPAAAAAAAAAATAATTSSASKGSKIPQAATKPAAAAAAAAAPTSAATTPSSTKSAGTPAAAKSSNKIVSKLSAPTASSLAKVTTPAKGKAVAKK